jgi:hypothetical protein
MEALTAPKSLERLRRIAIFVPIVAVALLEGVVYLLYPDLSAWPGRLVLAGVVGMGLVFFYGLIFDVAGRMQAQLEHQNRELLALHHGAIDIYGELSLDVVLQKVVDQVRVLLTARYSAIAVQDESGAVREFVQSGIDETVRARLPRGGACSVSFWKRECICASTISLATRDSPGSRRGTRRCGRCSPSRSSARARSGAIST